MRILWSALGHIVDYFRDRIVTPIADQARDLRDKVAEIFRSAVDIVKGAWSKLVAVYE